MWLPLSEIRLIGVRDFVKCYFPLLHLQNLLSFLILFGSQDFNFTQREKPRIILSSEYLILLTVSDYYITYYYWSNCDVRK